MRAVVVMLLSLVPGIASATDWAIPSRALGEALPKGCDASSDAGLYDCAAKAFEAADLALNQVWKAVLASIDESAASEAGLTAAQRAAWKSDLTAAQKAWAAFKDLDCNEARSFEYWGGSGRSLAVLSCQYEYTIGRTRDLKARYLDR